MEKENLKVSEYALRLEKYGSLKYSKDSVNHILEVGQKLEKPIFSEDDVLDAEKIVSLDQTFFNEVQQARLKVEKIEDPKIRRKTLDAIQMLDGGFEYDLISAFTELTEEEIRKIHETYLPSNYQETMTIKKVS